MSVIPKMVTLDQTDADHLLPSILDIYSTVGADFSEVQFPVSQN